MERHHLRKCLCTLVMAALFPMLGLTIGACGKKEMKRNNPRNIHGVYSYRRVFPDKNEAHMQSAKSLGISPLPNREAAERLKKSLACITDCRSFVVDSLTHSIPYLVPKAKELLEEIGYSFSDSLKQKGLNPYKIIVTSVLRTGDDVARLQKRNINALSESAHSYATTFDISWKRFAPEVDPDGRPLEAVGADTLKKVLSEVLRDFRAAGRCHIKYERKQGCFHITVR